MKNVRTLNVGEFGFMLADLETKTVHLANIRPPRWEERATGVCRSFDEFLKLALELFEGDELLKVVSEGLLIYSGRFDGTF